MNQFAAIIWDSLQEAKDKKSLLVLMIISSLVILFCFSISFTYRPLAPALQEHAESVHNLSIEGMGFSQIGMSPSVGEPRDATPDDGLPSGSKGTAVEVTFNAAKTVDELVREWREFEKNPMRSLRGRRRGSNVEESENVEDPPPLPEPLTTEERTAGLERVIARRGWGSVSVKSIDEEGLKYVIAAAPGKMNELTGVSTVHFGFGAFDFDLSGSTSSWVISAQEIIATFVVGVVGMLVAVFSTSGLVPSMLAKGSLDLVLARPIARVPLLLYRYIGGLWFIFLLASFCIGGCWVAFGLRAGYWHPAFLLSALVMTLAFALVHSISVLFGVLTKSGTVAGLLAVAVWWISSILVSGRHTMNQFGVLEDLPSWGRTAIDAVYTCLPKVKDFDYLTTHLLTKLQLSPAAAERRLSALPDINWFQSMGSNAVILVGMLALAAFIFRKRDY